MVAVIAVAAAVTAAGTANAAPARPAPSPAASAAVLHQAAPAGSARLLLSGSGRVVIAGRLAASGNFAARSTVLVIDRAGDASLVVAGVAAPFRRGRATVRRAQGIVWVAGSDLTVQVTGRNVDLAAAGVGRTRLTGKGTYRLNTTRTRAWPRAWVRLIPEQAPRAVVRARKR